MAENAAWLTSGSQLERVLACVASICLPSTRDEPHVLARRGSVIHEYIERAKDDRDGALEWVAVKHEDFYQDCADTDLDSLPLELAHEVAFAYDCAAGTAREIGRGTEAKRGDHYRAAKLGPFEIPCRLDVVGVSGDSVYVDDYKTGMGIVTAPDKNVQLSFGALCAMLTYGKERADVGIRQRKADGSWFRKRTELDLFDVDGLQIKLRALHQKAIDTKAIVVAGQRPNVYEGSHCKYCPAYHSCPAKTALAIRLSNGDEIGEIAELTLERAGVAWQRIKDARELLNKAERRIRAMAKETPIDLGNGVTLGTHEKKANEKLDGEITFTVIAEMFDDKVARKAVTLSATKKGIDDAIRPLVPKLAPAKKEIVEKIRALGGAERKVTNEVCEY